MTDNRLYAVFIEVPNVGWKRLSHPMSYDLASTLEFKLFRQTPKAGFLVLEVDEQGNEVPREL